MARRDEAKAEADPLRSQAANLETEAEPIREQLKALKAEKKTDSPEYATLSDRLSGIERAGRELKAKAQAIEDAAYDLKAVNPQAKNEDDTRTPEELLTLIDAKGREVARELVPASAKKA